MEKHAHDWLPTAVVCVVMAALWLTTVDWHAGVYGPW